MDKTTLFGTLTLALLVGAAACDRAGDTDADAQAAGTADQAMMQQQMDPETMAQIMEVQQIQEQLDPIQREALQDPALAAQLEALQTRIDASMRAEDPELFARIDRFQEEMAAAEAEGDQQKMQSLMMEAQTIQQEVQVVQARVFDRPDIRGPVEEFEAAHRARMIQIDPEAEALLDRMEAIIASLSV